MGNSLPPPAGFDLVDSYARRRGDEVEVVLALPAGTLAPPTAEVTFSSGRRSLNGTATSGEVVGDASRVILRAPRDQFANGIWSIALKPTLESVERVNARLLVQGERPLVLLWGARTPNSEIPVRTYPRYSRQWATAGAGRVLDRALTVLPDKKARRVRQRVRKTARRILH